ncbi:dimethylaniline monooxygenase (N-oxide forming) [Mollisia scopiformis]|uniref:Dimethylaniline monooxygenase (N-oxide forming) n=1 Tax=Mollisia scopiformis TaxID=149040 RepID=A0A194XLQ6_MOLSC|nr:dimethylaniline monooxygenase (N-oxide forming) [Mollisia scopiformis]KUJ21180.1 dimethylaniline monooxygenase (N-oxide forming) [Mollisia scopiformis]
MSTLVNYPCALPTTPIPTTINSLSIAQQLTPKLPHLTPQDFAQDALWRDIFALTGTLRTFHSATSVSAAWTETSLRAKVHSFTLEPGSVRVVRLPQGSAWIEARFSFETGATPATFCTAIVSLVPDQDGEWRIWVLRTVLEQLKGQPDVDVLQPVTELKNGYVNGEGEKGHFDCVVIGGGLAGLSTGGRLKALGVSYVVLDKNRNVGDNWKLRYGSARLHTNREYGHLPFERTFGPEYEEYLSKDDLAKGYAAWVKKFEINIWLGTIVESGTWDSSKHLWTLRLRQDDENDRLITASFMVLAGGAGGQVPVSPPPYQDRDVFEGTTLHSAEYTTPAQWKGKHGVVVGTANTAHDVADDMLQAGLASVTMIQRSKTYILPAEYYKKVSSLSYNATNPTEVADRGSLTTPFGVADLMSQAVLHDMASKESERFDSLERAGFKTERYGNIQEHILVRLGGHYMDVGASKKIAAGLIKVKSDTLPVRYVKDGLIFSDGTHLKADVIVFATGFVGNMREQVEQLFGSEIGDQVGDFWTLDKEGELKAAFKPTGHPAIWLHGGTIGQGRYYSRFIALQIKAKLLGTPLPLYEKTP